MYRYLWRIETTTQQPQVLDILHGLGTWIQWTTHSLCLRAFDLVMLKQRLNIWESYGKNKRMVIMAD